MAYNGAVNRRLSSTTPTGSYRGTAARKKKAPAGVPNINKYLGMDEQYQQDRNSLLTNFRNFRLQNVENRQNTAADYGKTVSRLAKDKSENLGEMQGDFGARGLYGSGVYQDELNDFNLGYANQNADALSSRDKMLQQLIADLTNARTGKEQNIQQARLEAIRRRATKYGLQA